MANSTLPLGTIVAYAHKQDPRNGEWLICDGRAISRTEYAQLFDIIGDTFGDGDREKTFNIPDFRGRFLRGVDRGGESGDAKRDPDSAKRKAMNPGGNTGNKVGSVQEDAFQSHTHKTKSLQRYGAAEEWRFNTDGNARFALNEHMDVTDDPPKELPYGTGPEGGKETRPKNAYVNWIIKAK